MPRTFLDFVDGSDLARRLESALDSILNADKPFDGASRVIVDQNEDRILIRIALADVPEDAVDITIDGQQIMIETNAIRGADSFACTVELPFAPTADGVQAVFADGVLSITVTIPEGMPGGPTTVAMRSGG